MAKNVEIFVDLPKFIDETAKILSAAVANDIASKAQNIVRVGTTGNLKSSIMTEMVNKYTWNAFSRAEYAAAQEWGLAPFGKPAYSFTPYMRPSAASSTEASNLRALTARSQRRALELSKV